MLRHRYSLDNVKRFGNSPAEVDKLEASYQSWLEDYESWKKISRRVVILSVCIVGSLVGSCGNRGEEVSREQHVKAAENTTSKEVIADYKILTKSSLPIRVDASRTNDRLTIVVKNGSGKPVFAPSNLLSQGMAGVPLVFLVVRDSSGRTLYVCGRFEDSPIDLKSVEIQPNKSERFDVSVAEIQRRYCTKRATVTVQIVEPIGRNFISFASSAETSID